MNPSVLVSMSLLLISLPVIAQEGAGQQSPAAPVPAVQIADAPADNPVVVKVLGEDITEKQVLEAIDRITRQQPASADRKQKNVMFYKDALDTLVGLALLKNQAKEKNITVTTDKVDAALDSLKKRFPDEQKYKQAMLAQGFSEADVRKQIEDSLVLQQVVDTAIANLPVPTDAEIQKFYDNNPQYFQSPEQVRAAHILLKVDSSATPEKKAETRKKLEDLRAEIESQKITFAEAAKTSDDKSNADKGGDLGFFQRGQMVKPFEDAAFAAKPGTVTGVIETQFGYHIIHVIESKPAGKVRLETSKKDIQGFLERQNKQAAVQKHIASLRAKANIEQIMTDEEWNKRNAGK